MKACRVCGSATVSLAGDVEYLQGHRYAIYDCESCGCRLTRHDPSVHDAFHRAPVISYYQDYSRLAETCAAHFKAGDLTGLRRELSTSAKYRFVMEHVDRLPRDARLLEIGCARGFLTSYAILQQRHVLGVDVSREAVDAATAMFGPHFMVAETPRDARGGPFDLIYHVGLIGCVADPIGLTRELLQQLKPGGALVFNAPNRAALHLRGQLWLDSAPPPDLVTLFPPGFWQRQFGDSARVEETIEHADAEVATRVAARQWLGVAWQPPAAQPSSVRGFNWTQPSGGVVNLLARAVAKGVRSLGLSRSIAARPTDFGIFVRMVKQS